MVIMKYNKIVRTDYQTAHSKLINYNDFGKYFQRPLLAETDYSFLIYEKQLTG